ncbi:hypothetical protein Moror_3421 [Moniliophthora roreri MCA 2997]|uniref:Uncharacterized protein n=2 Tax=Moniliophthora roreri TaxID=221103 RepID=V2Y5G5_MONRO|nr:hypothetical protein Moror_3421 [Moniliophthora roreri MCA 2997]
MDNDLVRLWHLINELSDQLAHNHKITKTLQSQASTLKNEVAQINTGFTLRRYNTDITKETFDSDLERTSAQIIIENQGLLHENKQLSLLLKEYEGTLETIMIKFRNHALAAQQHEHTLTRHYETLLMARETQDLSQDLTSAVNMSKSLQRLLRNLRSLLRSMSSEDDEEETAEVDGDTHAQHVDPAEVLSLLDKLTAQLSGSGVYPELSGPADWSVEREHEISRLEKENDELRRRLGIDQESILASGIDMDAEIRRMECDRHPILSVEKHRRRGSGHSRSGSGDQWERGGGGGGGGSGGGIGSYWDTLTNANNKGPQQQHQPQPSYSAVLAGGMGVQQSPGPNVVGGAPLQRAIDLPGMRMGAGPQGRRLGTSSPQRGGWPAAPGRGAGAPSPTASASSASAALSLWSNQQPSSSVSDRPWPMQGGGGGGGGGGLD